MPFVLLTSDRFGEHQTPPGHPESPERAAVMDAVARVWRDRGAEIVAPREATHEQLARVHQDGYLRRLDEVAGRSVALDPDTYTSPESIEIARLAAGAAVDAVERVWATPQTRAFAMVRPPGHHAEANRAMGFCFYNNIAVAAAHARSLGADKIAIVDYDVHHGNGTQRMFEDNANVLYISTHQFPYYPGTGAADEIGRGRGQGLTVNVPLEVGSTDDDYRLVFDEIVVPILTQFGADIVLVSAGFDAHERDPIAGMRLTTPAFAAMTMALRRAADQSGAGRFVGITEGGYDLHALEQSLHAAIEAAAADHSTLPRWPTSSARSSRGRQAIARVKASLGGVWKLG